MVFLDVVCKKQNTQTLDQMVSSWLVADIVTVPCRSSACSCSLIGQWLKCLLQDWLMHYVLSTMVVNNGCDKNIATLLPMTNILECYSIRVHLWIFRNRKVDGNKYIRNHEQANHELKSSYKRTSKFG